MGPMDDHAGDPPGGGEHVLARLPRLTATQARRIAIAHADAYSDERRAARAPARAIAREQGRLEAPHPPMQQARGGAGEGVPTMDDTRVIRGQGGTRRPSRTCWLRRDPGCARWRSGSWGTPM